MFGPVFESVFCSSVGAYVEPKSGPGSADLRRQHFLYFFPLPQGHGLFRPTFFRDDEWPTSS